MLTKDDCLSLLVNMEQTGIDVNKQIKQLISSTAPSIDILEFIVQNNGIEATNFYNILRIKHNKNNSKLYTNLVSESLTDPLEIVTTLTSLLTQIMLHCKNLVETKQDRFLTEVRAKEITDALGVFFTAKDATLCLELYKLIHTDLLVLEGLAGKRKMAV